jgi:hypothetical protein
MSMIIEFIRCIICLLIKDDNLNLFIMFGDFCYFLNVRYIFNMLGIVLLIFALICQFINYYNYKNGIWPHYVKPFHMMSGLVSPKSIGIYDRNMVKIIQNRAKLLFRIITINCEIIIPLVAIIASIPLYLNCNFHQLLIYAIPWTLILIRSLYSVAGYLDWQLVYFYLICLYLKLKIRNVNHKLIEIIDNRIISCESNIKIVINKINKIYIEIDVYNNYWSIITFWTYFMLTFIFGLILCGILFTETYYLQVSKKNKTFQ